MDYPLPINFGDYHDQTPQAQLRTEFDVLVSRQDFGANVLNTTNVPECGIVELRVECPETGITSQKSFSKDHRRIKSASKDRFHFAPGHEGLKIHWKFKKPEYITQAKIELFRMSDAAENAIWSQEIDWEHKPCTKEGTTDFDGNVSRTDPVATNASKVEVAQPLGLSFPGDLITVEHSPYKLKMTITGILDGANLSKASRWVYVDVLFKELVLEYGDGTELELNRPDITKTFTWDRTDGQTKTVQLENRVLGYEGEILRTLRDADISEDNKIYLDSHDHAFITELAQYKNDEMFRRFRDLWGDGPRIPIFGEIKLKASNGESVSSPNAVGDLKFLWDWEDGRKSKISDWQGSSFQKETKSFLEKTLSYYVALDSASGDQPHGSTNCHYDYGGKRGALAKPVFPTQSASSYDDSTVNLLPGEFPIRVDPCPQRKWAAVSGSRSSGVRAGYTGAIFQPSRMAGDTYKLTVYFLPPGADVQFDLRAERLKRELNSLFVSTGVFEMWRRLKIYYYSKGADPCNIETIKKIYAEAGIEFDVSGPDPFDDGDYATAINEGIEAFLTDPGAYASAEKWGHMLPAAQPAASTTDCCLTVLECDDYLDVLLRLKSMNLFEVAVPFAESPKPTQEVQLVRAGPAAATVLTRNQETNDVMLATTSVIAANDRVRMPDGTEYVVAASTAITGADKDSYFENIFKYEDGITPEEFSSRYTQIREGLTGQILKRFAVAFIDNAHPDDNGIFFFHFRNRVNGEVLQQPVTGWAPSDAAQPHRSIFFVTSDYEGWQGDRNKTSNFPGRPTRADLRHWKPRDPVIAHEIGHNLCVVHAQGGDSDSTSKAAFHVELPAKMTATPIDRRIHCVMNYHPKAERFCGYCILRLRGWSAMGGTDKDNGDNAGLIELINSPVDTSRPGMPEIIANQAPVFKANRLRVGFRITRPFAGTARLTRSNDQIRVFDSPNGGSELAFDGVENCFSAAEVNAGKWLYLNSVGQGTVVFTLDPQDGNPPATYEFQAN